jgi:hypothetical protein
LYGFPNAGCNRLIVSGIRGVYFALTTVDGLISERIFVMKMDCRQVLSEMHHHSEHRLSQVALEDPSSIQDEYSQSNLYPNQNAVIRSITQTIQ